MTAGVCGQAGALGCAVSCSWPAHGQVGESWFISRCMERSVLAPDAVLAFKYAAGDLVRRHGVLSCLPILTGPSVALKEATALTVVANDRSVVA